MRKKERGFSLIENLFGIFLVATAAAIMAATLPVANTSRARADLLNKASGIAQKQLELIKNAGFQNATPSKLYGLGLLDSAAPAGNGMYPFTNVDNGAYDAPSQVLPEGKGFVGITPVSADLVEVTVLVTWNDRGKNRSLTVSTFLANL